MLICPSSARLIAYIDGELGPRDANRAMLHVERCTKCRQKADEISADLRRLADCESSLAQVPSGAVETALESLLHTVRARRVSHLVATRLEPYFGWRTAAALAGAEGTTPLERRELIAAVEPIATAFLGSNASRLLIGEVVRVFDDARSLPRGLPYAAR